MSYKLICFQDFHLIKGFIVRIFLESVRNSDAFFYFFFICHLTSSLTYQGHTTIKLLP